jgi:hypothetical protein
VDTVRAATDISARLRIVPGLGIFTAVFTGFRDQRSPPPDHYRTNVYSIMDDTPKAARKFGKYGLMRERDLARAQMVSGTNIGSN